MKVLFFESKWGTSTNAIIQFMSHTITVFNNLLHQNKLKQQLRLNYWYRQQLVSRV